MWIKICGNTRLQDCLLAADLGADAVGFVFAPGKRTVTATQVAAITAKLPSSLDKFGVFTTKDAATIAAAADQAGLTGIQLHGIPDRALLERLLETTVACKLIQVLHWSTDLPASVQRKHFAAQVEALSKWDLVEMVLVDSQTATASGGTGTAFDWAAVAPLLSKSQPPVIAAGGLKPETVSAAISILKPWGVDVSSGVEDAPGVKNADAVRIFIQQARNAGLSIPARHLHG